MASATNGITSGMQNMSIWVLFQRVRNPISEGPKSNFKGSEINLIFVVFRCMIPISGGPKSSFRGSEIQFQKVRNSVQRVKNLFSERLKLNLEAVKQVLYLAWKCKTFFPLFWTTLERQGVLNLDKTNIPPYWNDMFPPKQWKQQAFIWWCGVWMCVCLDWLFLDLSTSARVGYTHETSQQFSLFLSIFNCQF
jgi:hypothetical protein